jgi:hypothetical protein
MRKQQQVEPMSYPAIRSEPTQNIHSSSSANQIPFSPPPKPSGYPIIVHSHLCWDWVWQRPQQFVSRLSNKHKVLFVETLGPDPGLAGSLARFERLEEFPNITLLRLQFPTWRWNDGEYVDRERRRLGTGAGAR